MDWRNRMRAEAKSAKGIHTKRLWAKQFEGEISKYPRHNEGGRYPKEIESSDLSARLRSDLNPPSDEQP